MKRNLLFSLPGNVRCCIHPRYCSADSAGRPARARRQFLHPHRQHLHRAHPQRAIYRDRQHRVDTPDQRRRLHHRQEPSPGGARQPGTRLRGAPPLRARRQQLRLRCSSRWTTSILRATPAPSAFPASKVCDTYNFFAPANDATLPVGQMVDGKQLSQPRRSGQGRDRRPRDHRHARDHHHQLRVPSATTAKSHSPRSSGIHPSSA